MYIAPLMIEPTTASIAIYLLSKTPRNINKIKRPYYIKKRICKWIIHNQNELRNGIIDETSDYIVNIINIIDAININPSIFIIIYIISLILIILL